MIIVFKIAFIVYNVGVVGVIKERNPPGKGYVPVLFNDLVFIKNLFLGVLISRRNGKDQPGAIGFAKVHHRIEVLSVFGRNNAGELLYLKIIFLVAIQVPVKAFVE